MDGKREMEAEDQRGKSIDELGLNRDLVCVPYAVEEAFPELLHVVVMEIELGWQPCLEEDPECSVSAALVA